VADRAAIMEDGTVVCESTPEALAAHPEVFERLLGVRQSPAEPPAVRSPEKRCVGQRRRSCDRC